MVPRPRPRELRRAADRGGGLSAADGGATALPGRSVAGLIGLGRSIYDSAPVRGARQFARGLAWRSEYRRLAQLEGIGRGRRAFLLGNGPSLSSMDLSPLAAEFVCVVNMGVRGVGTVLPHADMHVVVDSTRYRRFAADIEAAALRHQVPYRFLPRRLRHVWHSLPRHANRPIFLVPHIDKLADRRDLPPMSEGVLRTPPSVVLTGAVLLDYLGFSPVYVLGCDLDYATEGPYFYSLGTRDALHEADPKVIGRRERTPRLDEQFAVLRAAFERKGASIYNAGPGGQLSSLERVDFASLFEGPNDGASPRPVGPDEQ